MNLSVIICAHNPRGAYMDRVLTALKSQTLSTRYWELIVVDNASSERLAERFDLSWHAYARHIRENDLGLTQARLRGIAESSGEILVFVDDDNVLDPTYLSTASTLAQNYSFLGSWGAGLIEPEFEKAPAPQHQPYLIYLTLRNEHRASWSNSFDCWPSIPKGAGLCVRRQVAERYALELRGDAMRSQLDRRGQSLDGAGDIDLAFTPARLNLGWGTFPELRLTHLIPRGRTEEDYLIRIMQASVASTVILRARIGIEAMQPPSRLGLAVQALQIFLRKGVTAAKFHVAYHQGAINGFRRLHEATVFETATSS